MNYRITADRAAAVSPSVHWLPIDDDTPSGVKLQLTNRLAGVAHYGIHTAGSTFYTHWAPLPSFSPDDKKD